MPDTNPPIDWRDIPVFIVNRNRLHAMQRLIEWLLAAGTRRVVILDNASNYAPLLAYYEALPTQYAGAVKLLRFEENHGPYVLWQQRIHTVLDTPFVLTDSDVVPTAGCPQDLIGRLQAALQRWPDAGKVGCALRIDDLPDGYVEADTVRKWESQFWEHPVAPGVFAAPIDTTFALYPPFAEFTNAPHNLRLGWPCVAEHTPWYAQEHALSDEERHYREHTSSTFSNWSVAKKDSWVRRSERVAAYDLRPQVLHIDGGRQYVPGWTNAVPASVTGAMRDFDFDPARVACHGHGLPLADDSFDGLHVSHALGEVRDLHALMSELWRVAKPGARLVVREVHGQGPLAWQDGRQRRGFGEASFAFFGQPALGEGAVTGYAADWQWENACVMVDDPAAGATHEVVTTLVAVKPARPRTGRRELCSQPERREDARLDPAFERCSGVPARLTVARERPRAMPAPPLAVVVPAHALTPAAMHAASRECLYIHTGNHRNSAGIGDMVRFVKKALEDCGHEVKLAHCLLPGATHIVFECFCEPENVAPFAAAKAHGARFILVGTEPIVGGTFNGGIDAQHGHYDNTEYWRKRFDHFLLVASISDAVWVLAESLVEPYRAVLSDVPVDFLPHGYVEGYAQFEHLPEARKDIDFYFSGSMTGRRKTILETLARSYCVVHTEQNTGEYLRHDYIARAKVCLSLRLSENNLIPSVSRMHFHLQHKSFVLHEAYPLPCLLDPYVLHVPAAEFFERADEVVRSDRRRMLADAAYERFRAELPMTRLLPSLLDAALASRRNVGDSRLAA